MSQAISLPTGESLAVVQSPERFYEDHAVYVRTLLARLLGPGADPEDLTQEVFLRAWRKRDQIRPGSARAWLHSAAVKLACLERRKVWFRRVLGLESASTPLELTTPERVAEAHDARRRLYAALDQLSEKRRMVFILFEIQGLSGPEISASLGCPLKTVWTRLHHARLDLRTRLEDDAEPEPPEGSRRE